MGLIDFAETQMKAISDLDVMIVKRQTERPEEFYMSCEEMWGFMQNEAKVFLGLQSFPIFMGFVDKVLESSLSRHPTRVLFLESDGHNLVDVKDTFNELSERWVSLGHNIIKSVSPLGDEDKYEVMVVDFCAL